MTRTETMSRERYADLVRRIVAWVAEREREGKTTQYYHIRQRFGLRNSEVDDICGDSEVYGPQLARLARPDHEAVGYTHVEVIPA